MIPQDPQSNRGLWSGIESAVRGLARKSGKLYVVSGPIFQGATLKRLRGRVLVPTHIFKAVYDPKRKQAAAYLVENGDSDQWRNISIAELQQITGIDPFLLGAMVGRQLPFFSLIVPFWVVWAFAGWKGMKDVWPAILVTGGSGTIGAVICQRLAADGCAVVVHANRHPKSAQQVVENITADGGAARMTTLIRESWSMNHESV